MAALTLLVQVAIYLAALVDGDPLHVERLFAVACGCSILYMAGCAATTFATEHEMGTFDFHQALPVDNWSLLLGNVGFTVASTFALGLAMSITAWIAGGGRLPTATNGGQIVTAGFVTTLEMLAWGTLFSLLLRHPLRAALLKSTTICTRRN